MVVEWPAMAFRLAANGAAIQVPTLANLGALFDGDPLLERTVGPFVANEVGTEIIRTRNVMCVPPRYVPILLGQALSPREAYTRLGGAICTDRFEGDCAPLLAYLRAACTLQTVQLVPSIQCTAAPVLRVDPLLFAHIRDSLVHRDFP
jgi:hypothetical protein